MINALQVYQLAQRSIQIDKIINSGADTLLRKWRHEHVGKKDEGILRAILIECGWRYDRRGNGSWYHPNAADFPAPRDLRGLAMLMSEVVMTEALDKNGLA